MSSFPFYRVFPCLAPPDPSPLGRPNPDNLLLLRSVANVTTRPFIFRVRSIDPTFEVWRRAQAFSLSSVWVSTPTPGALRRGFYPGSRLRRAAPTGNNSFQYLSELLFPLLRPLSRDLHHVYVPFFLPPVREKVGRQPFVNSDEQFSLKPLIPAPFPLFFYPATSLPCRVFRLHCKVPVVRSRKHVLRRHFFWKLLWKILAGLQRECPPFFFFFFFSFSLEVTQDVSTRSKKKVLLTTRCHVAPVAIHALLPGPPASLSCDFVFMPYLSFLTDRLLLAVNFGDPTSRFFPAPSTSALTNSLSRYPGSLCPPPLQLPTDCLFFPIG